MKQIAQQNVYNEKNYIYRVLSCSKWNEGMLTGCRLQSGTFLEIFQLQIKKVDM